MPTRSRSHSGAPHAPVTRLAPPIHLAIGEDDRERAKRHVEDRDLQQLPRALRDLTIATCTALDCITFHYGLSVHEDKPGGLFLNPNTHLPLPESVALRTDEEFEVYEARTEAWYETPDGVAFLDQEGRAANAVFELCERVEEYSRAICRECGAPGARYTVDVNRVHVCCPLHAPQG